MGGWCKLIATDVKVAHCISGRTAMPIRPRRLAALYASMREHFALNLGGNTDFSSQAVFFALLGAFCFLAETYLIAYPCTGEAEVGARYALLCVNID